MTVLHVDLEWIGTDEDESIQLYRIPGTKKIVKLTVEQEKAIEKLSPEYIYRKRYEELKIGLMHLLASAHGLPKTIFADAETHETSLGGGTPALPPASPQAGASPVALPTQGKQASASPGPMPAQARAILGVEPTAPVAPAPTPPAQSETQAVASEDPMIAELQKEIQGNADMPFKINDDAKVDGNKLTPARVQAYVDAWKAGKLLLVAGKLARIPVKERIRYKTSMPEDMRAAIVGMVIRLDGAKSNFVPAEEAYFANEEDALQSPIALKPTPPPVIPEGLDDDGIADLFMSPKFVDPRSKLT